MRVDFSYCHVVLAAGALFALASCESARQEVVEIVGENFVAPMNGANERPRADPDGTGMARVAINDDTNRICTDLEVRDIGNVTAAHIHRGAVGVNGPPVVTLDPPDDNDSNDCDVVSDTLVAEILANPAGFYVNVHTADYPNGAIRGQLARALR